MVVLRRPGTILAALRPEPKADRPLLGGFLVQKRGTKTGPSEGPGYMYGCSVQRLVFVPPP